MWGWGGQGAGGEHYLLTFLVYFSTTFWQLVIFIEQGSDLVDGQVESPLNDNEIRKRITFKAANGELYEIADFTNIETVSYDSLFSFYTTSPIRYEDIAEVEEQVLGTWREAGE